MRAIAVSICLCGLLTGCLDTVRVKRAPLHPTADDDQQTNVPGVPFYIKVAQCKQETTWLQPYYTLTLKRTEKTAFVDEAAAKEAAAKDPSKPPPTLPPPEVTVAAQVLSFSNYQKPEVQELRNLVSGPSVSSENPAKLKAFARPIDRLWKTIAGWPTYVPLAVKEDDLVGSADAPQVTNKSTPDAVVDYSRVYYYNTPRPWIGTSTSNPTLATDGTLTTATSTVNSQTLQTLLGAVPISSVLSTVASAALKGAAATPPGKGGPTDPYAEKRTLEYELTIQQNAYTHTHTRYQPYTVPCPAAKGGVTGDNYALAIDAYSPTTPADTTPPATPPPANAGVIKPK